MGAVKILTVAEDNGISDRLTCVSKSYAGFSQDRHISQDKTLKISIDADRNLTLNMFTNGIYNGAFKFHEHEIQFEFHDVDVDGLIQYLQEVKVWLSEEDMIKKLIGK